MDGALLLAPRQFHRLTADWAARVWPQVEPFILKAIRRGHLERCWNTTDVLVGILKNEAELWIVHNGQEIDAAIVTRFVIYPRAKTLFVALIGGRNLKTWAEMVDAQLEDYGRRNGCAALEGGARKGWSRVAGYQLTGCTLWKDIA